MTIAPNSFIDVIARHFFFEDIIIYVIEQPCLSRKIPSFRFERLQLLLPFS